MSTLIMTECWRLSMPPTQKAVLISLADNANDQGVCWPSIPTICLRTCFSDRAVHRAIHWLEAHGLVEADRSNGRHTTYKITPHHYQAPPTEVRPRRNVATEAEAQTPDRGSLPPPNERQSPPTEVRSNRKEPSSEPSRTVNNARAKKPEPLLLPDWLPVDTWQDWVDCRKKLKAPLTDKAKALALRKLSTLKMQGHDPTEVLEQSILNGWKGLFAIQANRPLSTPASRHPDDFSTMNYDTPL